MADHDQKECPACSAAASLSSVPRDTSEDHRDAWLYGIVLGWEWPGYPGHNEEVMEELAEKHDWSPATVARLRRLRAKYTETFPCQKETDE